MEPFLRSVDMKIVCGSKTPTYGTEFSAGMDIYCNNDEKIKIKPGQMAKIPTNLKVQIPDGYFGAIVPRSSTGTKLRLKLANTVGIIDSDYRGEIILFMVNEGEEEVSISKNDRLAQMILLPYVKANIIESDDLDESKRGEGGFGSTGK